MYNNKKLSKSDLINIVKIYKLNNKNELELLIKNPKKILNNELRQSFMKVLFYKNPIKVMEGYYGLYNTYKKEQYGGNTKYPGDGYLEKYLNHNKNKKNIVNIPSFEELKINISKIFSENFESKDKKLNNIKNELDNEITNKINNIKYNVKDNLNSNLQKSIKKELKEKMLSEIRNDFDKQFKKMPKNEPKVLFSEKYNDSRAPFF